MKKLIISLLVILILASIGSGCAVKSPSINSFDASPTSIAPGANSVISWNVVGAESVSINHGVGNVALTGSRIVSPATTTVYTLTATNKGMTSTATTEVVVSATAAAPVIPTPTPAPTPAPTPTPTPTPTPMALPIINYFNASPGLISSGDVATLSWGVTDATTVTIDPGLGSVGLVGTAPVSPAATTEYTLTATNAAAGWQSVTITIIVGPAPPPTPAPDLIITDIIRSGSTISYVIKNDGTATASPSTSQLVIDGSIKATDAVGPLSAGASSTESFSYSYTCSGVSDSLAVQADKSDVVDESNEGNNARSESTMCISIATVKPGIVLILKPDLVITDIKRDGNKIKYKIKNQGMAEAGPSKTRLIVDGALKGIDDVGALPAGAEVVEVFASYDLPWILFHTFNVKVNADNPNDIAESDETNNARSENIHW